MLDMGLPGTVRCQHHPKVFVLINHRQRLTAPQHIPSLQGLLRTFRGEQHHSTFRGAHICLHTPLATPSMSDIHRPLEATRAVSQGVKIVSKE
jgi:hypothetical protein